MLIFFISLCILIGCFLQPGNEDFYFENIPHAWASHWQPFCRSRLPETVSAPAPTAELKSKESRSSLVTFLSALPRPSPALPSRSSRFALRVDRLFTPPCRRTDRWSVGGFYRGGRGRKGRSIITITFTPFIISKHHHHQRDEACLRSLETYRNTKPAAAAAAPNKMNRVDRTPSPDAV